MKKFLLSILLIGTFCTSADACFVSRLRERSTTRIRTKTTVTAVPVCTVPMLPPPIIVSPKTPTPPPPPPKKISLSVEVIGGCVDGFCATPVTTIRNRVLIRGR